MGFRKDATSGDQHGLDTCGWIHRVGVLFLVWSICRIYNYWLVFSWSISVSNEGSPIRKVFSLNDAWKVQNIKCLILDTNRVLSIGSDGPLISNMHARRIAGTLRKILSVMTEAQLTELRLLTCGLPCLPEWALNTVEHQPDRRFVHFGKYLVDFLNRKLKQKAVLSRVDSSIDQEWVWRSLDLSGSE